MSEILESLESLPSEATAGLPLVPDAWLWAPPAALLVLGLVLWLWSSWRRRLARRPPRPIPATPSATARSEWWRQEIEALRRRGARSELECRQACFALSQILRRRLDEAIGLPMRSRTADELATRVDAGSAELLRLLRAAKYDRRGPLPGSLDDYCDLALGAAAAAGPRREGRRPRGGSTP